MLAPNRAPEVCMRVDELRKTFEAAIGNLTPSKAQQMARTLLEPGAAKDQVARTATDLLEWSQKNRERLQTFIRREVQDQLRQMGVATQAEVEALSKRVRHLERSAATGAAKRTPSSRSKPTAAPSSGSAEAAPRKRTTTSRPKPTAGPEGGAGTAG
jgi:polyhydroxyalkanoate synthesis regulator phasin